MHLKKTNGGKTLMKLMRMGKSFEKTKIEKNKNEEGRIIERER